MTQSFQTSESLRAWITVRRQEKLRERARKRLIRKVWRIAWPIIALALMLVWWWFKEWR